MEAFWVGFPGAPGLHPLDDGAHLALDLSNIALDGDEHLHDFVVAGRGRGSLPHFRGKWPEPASAELPLAAFGNLEESSFIIDTIC
jgi:hypothetical protein